MSGRNKKILYGAFYLAVFVSIIYGILGGFNRRAVELPQSPEILPLRAVAEPEVFSLSDGTSVILGQFFNPNAGYGSPNFIYFLKFYDSGGRLLGEISDRSFIYPLETRYVFNFNRAVPAEKIVRIEVVFSKVEWRPAADFPSPKVFVRNIKTNTLPERIEVSGQLVNEDAFAFSEIRLTAVIFDNFGFPLFASEGLVTNLPSLGRRSFSVLFPAAAELVEKIDLNQSRVFAAVRR